MAGCRRSEGNIPDMSVTVTWTAPRRSVMASRMLSSEICAMVAVFKGESERL